MKMKLKFNLNLNLKLTFRLEKLVTTTAVVLAVVVPTSGESPRISHSSKLAQDEGDERWYVRMVEHSSLHESPEECVTNFPSLKIHLKYCMGQVAS